MTPERLKEIETLCRNAVDALACAEKIGTYVPPDVDTFVDTCGYELIAALKEAWAERDMARNPTSTYVP